MHDVIYVGEQVYAETIQISTLSYRTCFPQRRNFLYEDNCDFVLVNSWTKEIIYVDDSRYSAVLVDNPFISARIRTKRPIIFDVVDHYADILRAEYGDDARCCELKSLEETELARASLRIVQGPGMLKSIRKFGPTIVVPNGYDPALFYPEREAHMDGLPLLVFQGKLSPWYQNILNIVEACRGLPAILLIAGDGVLSDELGRRSLSNVRLVGALPLTEVAEYTRQAAICLFTTDDDSPIAVHEYKACGKPIVSVRGRIDWLIQHGKQGFLCDGSVQGYRNCLSTLLDSSCLRTQMGLSNLHSENNRAWTQLRITFWKELTRFRDQR